MRSLDTRNIVGARGRLEGAVVSALETTASHDNVLRQRPDTKVHLGLRPGDPAHRREEAMSMPRYPKYKDCGVEWLGAVPVHWNIKRLKRAIASIKSGTSVNALHEPAGEGQLGVLSTSCVYAGDFDSRENKTVNPEEEHRVSCPLVVGSLIVSRMHTPELIGAAGLVRTAEANLYLPDRLWQVTLSDADPAFVHHWTRSSAYRGQVQVAWKAAG